MCSIVRGGLRVRLKDLWERQEGSPSPADAPGLVTPAVQRGQARQALSWVHPVVFDFFCESQVYWAVRLK